MSKPIFLNISEKLNKEILKEKKALGYDTRQELIKHILINYFKNGD